jgi:uncharacterized protein YceH (UPF0502 family)
MSTLSSFLVVDLSERRRSQRFHHVMRLIIRGEFATKRTFWEDTFSISISAHGALLILATKVALGQMLVLMNPQNWDERHIRVARIGSFDGNAAQVGVEFAQPAPEFWPVGAPPRKVSGNPLAPSGLLGT